MRFLFTLAFAIASLVVAAIASAAIAYSVAGAFGMSDFEGGRSMFASLVIGPVGGLAGRVAGSVYGWKKGTTPLERGSLGILAAMIALALILGTLVARLG